MIEKILDDALALWGARIQAIHLIEEMAELTKAIIKQYRLSDEFSFTPNMLEEMVDVTIMLAQIKRLLNTEEKEEFQSVFCQKMNRLEQRINEANAR